MITHVATRAVGDMERRFAIDRVVSGGKFGGLTGELELRTNPSVLWATVIP